METSYTQEQLKNIYSKINLPEWMALRNIKKCHYGCKGNLPLYTGEKDGVKLNPKYLVHISQTHGFPPDIFVEEIAKKLYKNKEDVDRMIKIYDYVK